MDKSAIRAFQFLCIVPQSSTMHRGLNNYMSQVNFD